MSARAAEHRLRTSRIMHDERLNFRGKKIALWNYILQNELTSGTQFLVAEPGGQFYGIVNDEGTTRVMQLPRAGRGGDRWFSYFHSTYGINEREDWNKFIYDSLRSWIGKYGTRVELRRFASFNAFTQTVYISGYNGRMYKIDGNDISDVPIGEDGVFFVDDDPGKHELPDIGAHGMLFKRLVDGINFTPLGLSGITPDQQRKAYIIWMFAIAFPDLMPTKPILLIEGAYGSGKTSVCTLLQLVLMGVENSMILQRNKEDDFGVLLLRSPIALFDNTDSYIEWVPDAIAAYTTLGNWTKRKLFTDDENMVIKPHAFIAVSSRNPASFRREDVADRCVILRLDRRKTFESWYDLRAQLLADRPQLLGEYLYYVGQIVTELREMRGRPRQAEPYRMADFAAFGRVVGRVLGWANEDVDKLMQALQGERDAFANEEDPLIDLLRRWTDYKPKHGPQPIGRLLNAFELHRELEHFAQIHSITWKDSPRTLVQKLRGAQIEREFFIERLVINGQPAFRIWRHTDTRLTVVQDDDQIKIETDG
jgi:hypothetical protein